MSASNQVAQLKNENAHLVKQVQELSSRAKDIVLKDKAIETIKQLVGSGVIKLDVKSPADVGINIKKMAEPIYDWYKQEPSKLNLV
jgi:hypothetical protein